LPLPLTNGSTAIDFCGMLASVGGIGVAVRNADGVMPPNELAGQQHDSRRHDAHDPEIQLAAGGMRDGITGVDGALALESAWGEFVEPREREPERKADDAGDHEPARDPVRCIERGPQLRDALRQRPDRTGIQHTRPRHVAAPEFLEQRKFAHDRPLQRARLVAWGAAASGRSWPERRNAVQASCA
jgi:hypothetical protein